MTVQSDGIGKPPLVRRLSRFRLAASRVTRPRIGSDAALALQIRPFDKTSLAVRSALRIDDALRRPGT